MKKARKKKPSSKTSDRSKAAKRRGRPAKVKKTSARAAKAGRANAAAKPSRAVLASSRAKQVSKKKPATAKSTLRRKIEALPYRPCAGLCVFNRDGLVFIGRRTDGPEHTDATHVWQMPQGGIDDGEDAERAALRELYEETDIRSVKKLGEIGDWLTYDIPATILGKAWKGRYRGQKQKWFALLFTGDDSEIDIRSPGGGHHKPEFIDWRWEEIGTLPKLVVPFKRDIYRRVVKEFRKYARRAR